MVIQSLPDSISEGFCLSLKMFIDSLNFFGGAFNLSTHNDICKPNEQERMTDMNKIKLLYDVVKTMRDKETLAGKLTVEGQKDHNRVFALTNEFTKNNSTGQIKADINVEAEREGHAFKHRSQTEFVHGYGHRHERHGERMRRWHHGHEEQHGGMWKHKWNRLAFAMHVLNELNVKEQEDGGAELTLELNECPPELRRHLQEKWDSRHKGHASTPHAAFPAEWLMAENPLLKLNVRLNANREIERVRLSVEGTAPDEEKKQHELFLCAELELNW